MIQKYKIKSKVGAVKMSIAFVAPSYLQGILDIYTRT